jgi:hypothetical protein
MRLVRVPSRQAIVLGAVLVAVAIVTVALFRSKPSGVTIGFWFEPITDDTLQTVPERLTGGVTEVDLKTIETMAIAEIRRAFADFQVSVTDRRDANYRVRVVDSLRHPMFPRAPAHSAESRSIPGLGGQGAVNFRYIAHSAIAFAPPHADRNAIVVGIGVGIGRAAVHEFAHEFLGSTPIHDTKNVNSYEYGLANRAEQYYGELQWDIARPLLEKRIGLRKPRGRSG